MERADIPIAEVEPSRPVAVRLVPWLWGVVVVLCSVVVGYYLYLDLFDPPWRLTGDTSFGSAYSNSLLLANSSRGPFVSFHYKTERIWTMDYAAFVAFVVGLCLSSAGWRLWRGQLSAHSYWLAAGFSGLTGVLLLLAGIGLAQQETRLYLALAYLAVSILGLLLPALLLFMGPGKYLAWRGAEPEPDSTMSRRGEAGVFGAYGGLMFLVAASTIYSWVSIKSIQGQPVVITRIDASDRYSFLPLRSYAELLKKTVKHGFTAGTCLRPQFVAMILGAAFMYFAVRLAVLPRAGDDRRIRKVVTWLLVGVGSYVLIFIFSSSMHVVVLPVMLWPGALLLPLGLYLVRRFRPPVVLTPEEAS
jgi:hypothetical protein